jgi:hypothetical protein
MSTPASTATPIATALSTAGAAPAAPAQNTAPAAPEGFISLVEHQSALEKIRQDEKSRLYPDLENARKQVETLSAQIQTLNGEKTILATSIESLKAATEGGKKFDVAKLVEEVSLRAAKSVTEGAQAQILKLETQLAEMQRSLNAASLKDAREKLIAAAGGAEALIPELVSGNTEEELKKSVAESKRIFDSVVARRGNTTPTPAAGTPVAPAPAPSNVAAPIAPAPNGQAMPVPPAPIDTGSGTLRAVPEANNARHNPTEWKAIRENRLKEAAGRYPTR